MNAFEKKMVWILQDLSHRFGAVSVKFEFESEGTRLEDAMRLKEITMEGGLTLIAKIGGCESLRDIQDCQTLGVSALIAPMIESSYALRKFVKSALRVYSEESSCPNLYINIETETSFNRLHEILYAVESLEKPISGFVIGRVDLCGSLEMGRGSVDSQKIRDYCFELGNKYNKKSISEIIIGGGISPQSIPFLSEMPFISGFETRKIKFKCPDDWSIMKEGIQKAVEFELLWLRNKKERYEKISQEDDERLNLLNQRL